MTKNIKGEVMINKTIKNHIFILNQIFEIENKLAKITENNSIGRNIDKLKNFYENELDENISFIIENPKNEEYNETRTDVEANIIGESVNNLVIVDVIKPIIRIKQGSKNQIIQKGIVIVQDKNTIIEPQKEKQTNKFEKCKTKIVKVFISKGRKKKKTK